MATINTNSNPHHINLKLHSAWDSAFSQKLKDEQIEDDLFAGRSVSKVLTILVALGLLLTGVTVGLIVMTS